MNKGFLDMRKSILFIEYHKYMIVYISKILFMKFEESNKLFLPIFLLDEIIPYSRNFI